MPTKRKTHRSRRFRGGMAPYESSGVATGAAPYTIGVAGNMNDQHAVPGTNTLAFKGGSRSRRRKRGSRSRRRGGSMLVDVAVPAALVYMNNTYKKRRS